MRPALLLLLAISLAGCGSVGKLDASKKQKADIADYDHVVVGEFVATGDRIRAKPEEVEAGRAAFSEKIANALRKANAYETVELGETSQAPALKISGTIEQWQIGNIVARSLIGFVGMSEFDATVIVSDLASGEELARIKVNRNSWPLPVGTGVNLVLSVDVLMRQAARRVAAELARTKGIILPETDEEDEDEVAGETQAPPAR